MKIFFGRKNQPVAHGKLLTQIHSNHVIIVDHDNQETVTMKADALVTTLPQVKLSVKTADCIPILLYSQDVVAAIHAGWRGAHSGIIQNTVKVMQRLGAGEILAHIGPCIRQDSYEVDWGFYRTFITQHIDNRRFFKHLHFDLPGYCKAILNNIGITQILDEGIDTYTQPDSFYSYRHSLHRGLKLDEQQRQFSWIML
jgi:YfiH family protein